MSLFSPEVCRFTVLSQLLAVRTFSPHLLMINFNFFSSLSRYSKCSHILLFLTKTLLNFEFFGARYMLRYLVLDVVDNSSHLPAYEDGIECSETSAYKIQTPGNYPEESIQQSEQGESLESGIIDNLLIETFCSRCVLYETQRKAVC